MLNKKRFKVEKYIEKNLYPLNEININKGENKYNEQT